MVFMIEETPKKSHSPSRLCSSLYSPSRLWLGVAAGCASESNSSTGSETDPVGHRFHSRDGLCHFPGFVHSAPHFLQGSNARLLLLSRERHDLPADASEPAAESAGVEDTGQERKAPRAKEAGKFQLPPRRTR